MSDLAIQVEHVGKRYRIGTRERYRTFRDALTNMAARPFRALAGGGAMDESNSFWALQDVNFEVKRGEVVGIIGRNGAGKSTLLKILSRITEPTEGQVTLEGRVGSLLEVGTGFHPELTGRENIYLNGAILGMTRVEIAGKFDEIVDFSEIEKFLDTPVKQYSSGMYTRLAFAVAANLEPEILIVDEVLAVGDAAFQKKCLGKMSEVAKEGRTVLFVSHQMNAVERLCSTVAHLREGELVRVTKNVNEEIGRYLFGDGKHDATATWTNDTHLYVNPWFQPERFLLTDRDGHPISPRQQADAEVWVQLEGTVEQVDPALTVGYAIYAEDGTLLYWTYHTDTDPVRWPAVACGRVTLRSRLPARLLNEGSYRIELIGGLTNRVWLFEPGVSAPHITLDVRGNLSDSPMWMSRRAGLLAPVIPWTSHVE